MICSAVDTDLDWLGLLTLFLFALPRTYLLTRGGTPDPFLGIINMRVPDSCRLPSRALREASA